MGLILLQQLQQLQIDSHQKGYLNGIFASQRFHPLVPYKREDENIFFSSAIVYTLQEHYNAFSKSDQNIAENIIENTLNCYPNFKNFRGDCTYNFFKTNPMDFFPNGNIMQHFNFFKLADDSDDTAYVYLTEKNKNHKKLKQKLIEHANGTLKWNSFNLKEYKDLKVYSVYFGENMHIETDACVLSNILLWSFKNKLPLTKNDKDSLTFLLRAITSKDYIKHPYLVSPCYPTTAQICYHISRLIQTNNANNVLDVLKPLLIDDLKKLIQKSTSFTDKLFYQISLMNLGIKPKNKISYNVKKVLKSTHYFYTSVPLMIPKLWVRKLQKYKLFKILGLRTRCDGYTTALLLEYEILFQKF